MGGTLLGQQQLVRSGNISTLVVFPKRLSHPQRILVGVNEQLRLSVPTTPPRRQAHVFGRRLDDRTREIGRRGVAQARSILANHRRFEESLDSPIELVEAA
ncbi:MAG: hypothetical protein VX833_07195 [Actinomycetota bacterium]|nr:hypothetical protein [Actinomycetota bacterium]